MRELLRALFKGKPLMTMLEPEVKHGGVSAAQVRALLEEADRKYLDRWGDSRLGVEVRAWLDEEANHCRPCEVHGASGDDPASGLSWMNVGRARPAAAGGVEIRDLSASLLAAALEANKTEFSLEEWASFGVAQLRRNSFVRAGDSYYQPFDVDCPCTACRQWSGRRMAQALVSGVPIAQYIYDALFEGPVAPIEWNRLPSFQAITIQMLVRCTLPTTLQLKPTPLPRVQLPPPANGCDWHMYVSAHNAGALQLLREAAQANGDEELQLSTPTSHRHSSVGGRADRGRALSVTLHEAAAATRGVLSRALGGGGVPLLVTEEPTELGRCKHMLVYLTDQTWTRGDESDAFAEEVRRAMDEGVHLILAHEMPGHQEEVRHGCEFATLFVSERGTTPADLVLRQPIGIYHQIALPLKGGEWRAPCMAMLMQAISDVPNIESDVSNSSQEAANRESAVRRIEGKAGGRTASYSWRKQPPRVQRSEQRSSPARRGFEREGSSSRGRSSGRSGNRPSSSRPTSSLPVVAVEALERQSACDYVPPQGCGAGGEVVAAAPAPAAELLSVSPGSASSEQPVSPRTISLYSTKV